jgi:hypothetical protein
MSIGLNPPASVLAPEERVAPPRSLWSDAWARLRRNRMAAWRSPPEPSSS